MLVVVSGFWRGLLLSGEETQLLLHQEQDPRAFPGGLVGGLAFAAAARAPSLVWDLRSPPRLPTAASKKHAISCQK